MSTKIEWANPPGYKGESWNPITGCSPASPGCANCWARRMAQRFPGRFGGRRNPFKVTRHAAKLGLPHRWRKRRCVFVCSMGDLFHDEVADEWIHRVLDVVDACTQHRFLLLTKRPERMRDVLQERYSASPECGEPATEPAENLAGGVSVETDAQLHRVQTLLECQLAMRFASVEPMLGPVDFREHIMGYVDNDVAGGRYVKLPHTTPYIHQEECRLHWVIIGCESGPKRRRCSHEWVGDLLDQCAAASVPAFVKQMDIDGRVSHDPAEWPWRRRVRQWPKFLQPTEKQP